MNGHTVSLDNELVSIKVSNHLCVSFVRVESKNNHLFLKKKLSAEFSAATNFYFLINY